MELTRAPPPDVGTLRPEAAAAPRQEALAPTSAPPSASADRLDIQPLDLGSALQILIAEVRAELQLPVDGPRAQNPAQAAQLVVQLLLEALPDDPGTPSVVEAAAVVAPAAAPAAVNGDIAALERIDAAVRCALDRAVETVAAWRNVPHAVVDAARDARTLLATVLSDEPPSALWGRPEWAWLAPRVQRYWRRRRRRRDPRRPGLSDPDLIHPDDAGSGRRDAPAE